jgi:hypothetical protein
VWVEGAARVKVAMWFRASVASRLVVMALLSVTLAHAQGSTPQLPLEQPCAGQDCVPDAASTTTSLSLLTLPDAPQPQPKTFFPRSAILLKNGVGSAITSQPPCVVEQMPCRLTSHQKLQLFVKRSYSPYTFTSAAFDSMNSQWMNEKYASGMEGFARRAAANLADGETRSLFQTYIYSSLFHQDPRYHRLGTGNVLQRAAYAASRVFVGRTDAGGNAFNSPGILGALTTSAISNLYYPERDTGVGRTFNRALGGLGSDAGTYVLREFWPDIKSFFRRHESTAVRKMDDRMSAMLQ